MAASKIFQLAVEIVLICGVIGIAIFLFAKGKDVTTSFSDRVAAEENNIAESSITKFDGIVVSGSDVVNAIRGNAGTIDVSVARIITEGGDLVEPVSYDPSFVNLPKNNDYINPNAKFVGKVVRNDNQIITGLVFEQSSFAYSAQAPDRPANPGDGGNGGNTGGNGSGGGVTTDDALLSIASLLQEVTVSLGEIKNDIAHGGGVGGGGLGPNDTRILERLDSNMTDLANNLASLTGSLKDLQGAPIPDQGGMQFNASLNEIYALLRSLESDSGEGVVGGDFATSGDVADVKSAVDAIDIKMNALSSVVDKLSTTLASLDLFVQGDPDYDPTIPGAGPDESLSGKIQVISGVLMDLQNQMTAMQEDLEEIKMNSGGTP